MVKSTESASTPISAGGWKYDHDDEQDQADFARHSAAELRELETDGRFDFSGHPAFRPGVGDVGQPGDQSPAAQAQRAADHDADSLGADTWKRLAQVDPLYDYEPDS